MGTLQMHLGQEFLKFAVECEAFRFGEFTLKDGSKSDIFFDSHHSTPETGSESFPDFWLKPFS